MVKNYNIIKLSVKSLYEPGTKPEGRIFAFSKKDRSLGEDLSQSWITAHWDEILELMTTKYLSSEAAGRSCGLIEAARTYFANHSEQLFTLARDLGLSLPELSLVIKQDGENRIFVPNFSIKQAQQGVYVPHPTLDAFFNSDSYNLLRCLIQYTAANPDSSRSHEEQQENFFTWVGKHGEEARKLLGASFEFHPGQIFVEGRSPDDVLAHLGHLSYDEIAQRVVIKTTLEDTIEE